jgi:hypothetical protein
MAVKKGIRQDPEKLDSRLRENDATRTASTFRIPFILPGNGLMSPATPPA